MNDIITDALKKDSAGLLNKAYDDMVHPAAEAIGAMISYPFRGMRVLCGKYEKWLINREESLRIVGDAICEKMKYVPPEKQCVPEAYVAIPTMQQICLSQDSEELRDMYANLLAASMNTDTKDKVLPGFVNVIGQLSPDEAKLLKFMYEKTSIPALHVKIKKDKENNKEYITALDCFVVLPKKLLDVSNNLNLYLGNLQRLQLISIDYGNQLTGREQEYTTLIDLFRKNAAKNEFLKDKYFIFHGEVLEITYFGFAFAQICLGNQQ